VQTDPAYQHILVTDGSLVGAHEPSPEKRDHAVDARQQLGGGLHLLMEARVVDISCGSLESNPMPDERMLFTKLSAGDAVLPTDRTGLHGNR